MKKCTRCLRELELSCFGKRSRNKDGLYKHCKECESSWRKEYYKKNRDNLCSKMNESGKKRAKRNMGIIHKHLSENACVDCGEDDIVVLEFDHVRGKKEYNICDMVRYKNSVEKLEKEIAKCEIRCANCHRRKTAIDQGRRILNYG